MRGRNGSRASSSGLSRSVTDSSIGVGFAGCPRISWSNFWLNEGARLTNRKAWFADVLEGGSLLVRDARVVACGNLGDKAETDGVSPALGRAAGTRRPYPCRPSRLCRSARSHSLRTEIVDRAIGGPELRLRRGQRSPLAVQEPARLSAQRPRGPGTGPITSHAHQDFSPVESICDVYMTATAKARPNSHKREFAA